MPVRSGNWPAMPCKRRTYVPCGCPKRGRGTDFLRSKAGGRPSFSSFEDDSTVVLDKVGFSLSGRLSYIDHRRLMAVQPWEEIYYWGPTNLDFSGSRQQIVHRLACASHRELPIASEVEKVDLSRHHHRPNGTVKFSEARPIGTIQLRHVAQVGRLPRPGSGCLGLLVADMVQVLHSRTDLIFRIEQPTKVPYHMTTALILVSPFAFPSIIYEILSGQGVDDYKSSF